MVSLAWLAHTSKLAERVKVAHPTSLKNKMSLKKVQVIWQT